MNITPSNLEARNISVRYGKPSFQIQADRGTSFFTSAGFQTIARDERFTNTLIRVTTSRKARPALSLWVDDSIIEVPQVDCRA